MPERRPTTSAQADRAEAGAAVLDMHAIAPPWDYNPSAWRQRVPICILATVAFVIATYMGLYQWRLIDDVWDPVFGDQSKRVLDSDVSHWMYQRFRVPDAIFGAFAYLGDAIFGLAGSTRRWQTRPWLVILFGIDVIPLGVVSAVLVFMQGAVVGSWCFLCLVTAVISLVLVYMAYDEVWSSLLYLRDVWRATGSRRAVWNALVGRPVLVDGKLVAEYAAGGKKYSQRWGAGHVAASR